ncbi:MAG TPA: GTPase ObgE [Candidatus Kapabacteria bacterium]|jgi:GTP-binding protein|nr:GTPase ObgE [Candidatus Kapabacteria bacterium]
MKFIDVATISVQSGKGGKGHVSFRREKYVPLGGPDGGNGGKGGDVIFRGDIHINTLLDFRFQRNFTAEDGRPGDKSRCTGRDGKDMIIRVPMGTEIHNAETHELIADITPENPEYCIARGGKGGRGNWEFRSSINQAPRNSDPGMPGESCSVTLELKVLADIGIVGFPNAGKSTLISVISAAKPKIADYPFTTLVPNLGMVRLGDMMSFTVADIPGLIEGAHEGKGLGIQFLRHVERTKVLVFLLDAQSENPKKDYEILCKELELYNTDLAHKKRIICISKSDTLDDEKRKAIEKIRIARKKPVIISSVAGENITALQWMMWEGLQDS